MDNVKTNPVCSHSCVDCGVMKCGSGQGTYPEFCLTAALTDEEIVEIVKLYLEPENNRVAVASAEIEGAFYGQYTRVEETIEFAKRIGAKKIGIATCIGLLEESRVFAKILRLNGFEVFSAACKVGAIEKSKIGINPVYGCLTGNSICNPILQAKLLAKEKVDMTVMLGLCVGHDSLFYKYSEGIVTTLVVKDRVLGNNPVQALYQTRSYYRCLLMPASFMEENGDKIKAAKDAIAAAEAERAKKIEKTEKSQKAES